MWNTDPMSFTSLYYPFEAFRLRGASTVWISERFGDLPAAERGSAAARSAFAERFACAIPGGVTFGEVEFDQVAVQCLAERYGGFGIADNGGGARCGNVGRYQVKGLGKNPLAGSRSVDIHHSYGGFKAVYAVHEAIYSHLLNRIMPEGAAHIYGVTVIGPRAAFVSGQRRGWGGQLVREMALRPGSFLRAATFDPDRVAHPGMMSDAGRVRGACKAALRSIGGAARAAGFFEELADRTARQMSFARIARVMHGAVTPSNLCLDGRWIDHTNTTFVCSTRNYAGGNRSTPSFFEERAAAEAVIGSLVRSFGKFTGIALPVGDIRARYKSRAQEGLSDHLTYLFGIDGAVPASVRREDMTRLTATVMLVLSAGPVHYDQWPEHYPHDDSILQLLQGLFLAAVCSEQMGALNDSLLCAGNPRAAQLLAPFGSLMRGAHACAGSPCEYRHFLVAAYITALKRCVLASYFYKGRLERFTDRLLDAGDIAGVGKFIESSNAFADWAFSAAQNGRLDILNIHGLRLSYCPSRGLFNIGDGGAYFSTMREVRNALSCDSLVFNGFDFDHYLRQIEKISDEVA